MGLATHPNVLKAEDAIRFGSDAARFHCVPHHHPRCSPNFIPA